MFTGFAHQYTSLTYSEQLQIRSHLTNMHDRYGSHVCGEGGEFESFVLDCPLYKRRIVVEQSEVVHHDSSDVAPVAYMRFNALSLKEKGG